MLSLNNPIRASICISLRHKMQAFTGLKWSQSHTAVKLPRQSSWALQALSECLTGSWLHVIRCFLLNIFFVTFLFTLFMLQCDSDYVDVSFVFIREVPGPLASFCVGLSWLTDSHRLWPCGSGVYSWIFTLSPVHPDITFTVDWAFNFSTVLRHQHQGRQCSSCASLWYCPWSTGEQRALHTDCPQGCQRNPAKRTTALQHHSDSVGLQNLSITQCWATEPQHHSKSNSVGQQNLSITQIVLGYRTSASLRWCWATEPQHHSDSVGLQNLNIIQIVLGYRTSASLRWC